MDASLRRRLTYAKWLYDGGATLAARGDQFSGMVAMHHFHNAVEIVLRAVILEHGLKPEIQLRNTNYEAMTTWVFEYADQKSVTLSHRDHVTALADRRNLVQHRGDVIAPEALEDSRIDCYQFLREAFRGYFDAEFDDFRPYDVLENSYVRKLFRSAEREMRQGNYPESIAACKLVVRLAEDALDEMHLGSGWAHWEFYRSGRRLDWKADEDLKVWLKQLKRIAVLSFLGVDARATGRFAELGISVSGATTESSRQCDFAFWKVADVSFDEADVRRALDYAFEISIRMQEIGLIDRMRRDFGLHGAPLPSAQPSWECLSWEPPPDVVDDGEFERA